MRTLSRMTTESVPLLTKDQVADLLQVSRRTVERMEENGELQPVRIGRIVRYRPEDIEAFIGRKSA